MNREIKFRAWDTYDNKWRYFTIGQAFGTLGENLYKSLCLEGATFCQYTGLKDKNGKEIYEGDIVKDAAPWSWVVRFGECKYDGQTFVGWYMEHPEREDFSGPFSEEDCAVLEVIGNIYEAPELFKHGI